MLVQQGIQCAQRNEQQGGRANSHRIMRTRYRIDTFQKTYFVIDSFEQLFDATRPDFTQLYPELRALPTLGAGDIANGDQVIHVGTREGWADSDDI